ncbi:hypothetical protein BBK82_34535 [Lentzea guizhouensis]|uniref:Uncharacterized protein n=1 Tax=Lentzea guizhouensis TaxID=1586287 RepID=A0A1B2HRM4_9PSEU|nr:hypothetical protein BBK82_34535 [Lentzea guizhouensis]
MTGIHDRETTMHRLPSVLTAIAVACTSAILTAAPATAAPEAASRLAAEPAVTTSDAATDRLSAWKRYRKFEHVLLCEAAGAGGVAAGRWSQWRCDDQNVLWVNTIDALPLP